MSVARTTLVPRSRFERPFRDASRAALRAPNASSGALLA
jgi:hypothetical protein